MKNKALRAASFLLGTIWLLALLGCVILLAFPGIRGFYTSLNLNPSSLQKQGETFKFTFDNPYNLWNPGSLLVLENGSKLNQSYNDDPRYQQAGAFYVVESKAGLISGGFIPTKDAQTGMKPVKYTALVRLNAISGNNVGRLAVLLGLGALLLLIIVQSDPARPGIKSESLKWLTPILNGLRFTRFSKDASFRFFSRTVILKSISLILSVCLVLTLSEWLFLVTKSSFLDVYSFSEKAQILLSSFFLISSVAILALLAFHLIGSALAHLSKTLGIFLTQIPSAILCTSLLMLLVDNFLNTIFRTQIANSDAVVRLLTVIITLVLFLVILNRAVAFITSEWSHAQKGWFEITFGVFALSTILTITSANWGMSPKPEISNNLTKSQKPNIILISSDGVNAKNLSLYGYSRETTPFLNELGKTSLVAENNFTNANHTFGSLASVLTGRLPITTRVLYSPDILRQEDAFKHLPEILQSAGYRTVSLGFPYYADVNVMDFQGGFNEVNCQGSKYKIISVPFFPTESYFISQIKERIGERFFHIFFIENMKRPNANDALENITSDQDHLHCLKTYLGESARNGQPLFVQIHQMGTHGAQFASPIQRFSNGQFQKQDWMTDFYDDAILNFDSEVSDLFSTLNTLGLADKTIVVIFSDHGMAWTSKNRLPLIIHFPNNEHAGELFEDSQNLDIAPTILDYLGIDIPNWMSGSSLLEPLNPNRVIYSFQPVQEVEQGSVQVMPPSTASAKYAQFAKIYAFQCQEMTTIDLESGNVDQFTVEGYAKPCPPEALVSREDILKNVNELLLQSGFPALEENKTQKN